MLRMLGLDSLIGKRLTCWSAVVKSSSPISGADSWSASASSRPSSSPSVVSRSASGNRHQPPSGCSTWACDAETLATVSCHAKYRIAPLVLFRRSRCGKQ